MGENPSREDRNCRDRIIRMPAVVSSASAGARQELRAGGVALIVLLVLVGGCSRTIIRSVGPQPTAERLLFEQGLASFREFTPTSYSRAAELFRQAVDLEPGNCGYRLHLAEALLLLALEQRLNQQAHQANWDEAIAVLESSPTAVPAATRINTSSIPAIDCSVHEAWGLRLEAISLLDEFQPGGDRLALTQIARAIELEPGDPLNWFVRWKLNPSTRRQENAILQAASLSDDLALIHYEVGNYRLITADYKQARESFERALELSPWHFRSYIGLAQAISAADDAEDVEHLYRKAAELAPGFVEGRIMLGDYLAGLEETEAAIAQYQAVIEQNPDYEIAHLRLGVTLLQVGNFEGSRPSFERAIELNPSSYQAYYYLGNVWLSRRELDRAMELYEESLKYVLNFPEALYALGTVHFRKDNLQLALDYFEQVLERNRRHADAYFSRGAIYVQRKRYSQAIDDYNRALALYDQRLVRLGESIVELEDRGLTRKADLERRRRARVERSIERTLTLKMEAEDLQLREP